MRRISFVAVLCALFAFVGCETQQTDTEIGEGAADVEEETETEGVFEQDMQGNYYNEWNMDQEQGLSQQEFMSGLQNEDAFNEWDENNDNFLTQEEFDDNFSNVNWYNEGAFTQWDTDNDGRLGENEVYQRLFEEMDENNNGVIEEHEFDNEIL